MNWILVITLMINTAPTTVQVNSFNSWVCNALVGGIKDKTITINKHPVIIKKAECVVA